MESHNIPSREMHIGELAERVGLSHRTIRYYDEVGLLPASRTDGGFRIYTENDCDRLMLIRQMKPLGFTLEQMTELFGILDSTTAAECIEKFLIQAREGRAKLQRRILDADALIARLEDTTEASRP